MKKLLALLLALAMLLSLCCCGRREDPAEQDTPPAPDAGEQAPEIGDFPVSITDASGNTVTLEEKPERIVSGYYISTSMLIALGVQDALVGVEAKADSRSIYSLAAPAIVQLPSVGTAKEFDLEGCAALEPDLVVLPLKLEGVVPTLRDLGIPAITVNPESAESLLDTMTMLGTATGSSDRAALYLDYYSSAADDLAARIAALNAEKPTVYLAGNDNYLRTAGAAMYQDELIRLAGGSNIASELEGDYWVDIDYEQLLLWDPDVIIIAPEAEYTAADLMADAALAELSAVKEGRVYAMPGDIEAWDSPVPGTILGSIWMADCLYPQLYEDQAAESEIMYFYSTFYGIAFDK